MVTTPAVLLRGLHSQIYWPQFHVTRSHSTIKKPFTFDNLSQLKAQAFILNGSSCFIVIEGRACPYAVVIMLYLDEKTFCSDLCAFKHSPI